MKIKNIEYNKECVKLETKDHKYTIPINNDYVKKLVSLAVKENKDTYKDIKYYNKCVSLSLYPIWIAAALALYAVATNFLLLDLAMIMCGGMSILAITNCTIVNAIIYKLKNEANNNEYWTELYQYAKGNKKRPNVQRKHSNININSKVGNIVNNCKVIKDTEYSCKKNQIIQDVPIKKLNTISNNSTYHYTKNNIIQDEVEQTKKR